MLVNYKELYLSILGNVKNLIHNNNPYTLTFVS